MEKESYENKSSYRLAIIEVAQRIEILARLRRNVAEIEGVPNEKPIPNAYRDLETAFEKVIMEEAKFLARLV